jgi:hypothetical protein
VTARRNGERSRSSRKGRAYSCSSSGQVLRNSRALRETFNASARVERWLHRSRDSLLNAAVNMRVCNFVRKELSSR